MNFITVLGLASLIFVAAFTARAYRNNTGTGQTPRGAIAEAWINILIGHGLHGAAATQPAINTVEPHVGAAGSQRNGHASAADLAPRQPRPGSEDCQRLPSRVGERLYWPGGRVTDLDNNKVPA